MNVKRNYFKGKSDYTVFYQSIKGVDLSSPHSQNRTRLAYAENMYRDYDGEDTEAIVSVPGFRSLCYLGARVNSLFEKKSSDTAETVIAHAGSSLYALKLADGGARVTKIASAKDTKSAAVNIGNELFVFDGEGLTKIDDNETAHKLGDEGAMPYVPIAFKDGEPYEQRNLLTDACRERFTFATADFTPYGTPELIYKITDTESLTCSVTGVEQGFAGSEINVPSYVTIGELSYRIEEISDGAFKGNDKITALNVHEGPIRIGKEAFYGCRGLSYVRLPDSVIRIGEHAFEGCERIASVFLGKGLTHIGEGAFEGCISTNRIDYAAGEEEFLLIENREALPCEVNYKVTRRRTNVTVKLTSAAKSVLGVKLNGEDYDGYAALEGSDGIIRAVSLRFADTAEMNGKVADITVEALPSTLKDGENADVLSFAGGSCTGPEAVTGCTLAQAFDGRIFLSGNPRLPNTVIYSARDETGRNNPLYYGVYNYFNDGVAAYPVIALLATADSLAVFKADDDGAGSIFYHTPKDTDSQLVPKIYPVSYIHSGICASGEALSFYDDPVFVTRKGICALDKRAINLDRSIAVRSHNINPELLSLPKKDIRLARWCGYLVVSACGKMFLGDSRATFRHECGDIEYEWFFLNGIGSYRGDETVYRYTSERTAGFFLPRDPDGIATDTVFSYKDESLGTVYFTSVEGKRYRVYPTDRKIGGIFSPATALLSINEERLFFGTEDGSIMTFNNDMRGLDPDGVNNGTRRLHHEYYGFASHAPRYAISTAYDNCSVPHLEKSTVKGSLTVKCGVRGGARLRCDARCDNGEWSTVNTIPNAELDFSCLDFSTLSFSTTENSTIPLDEKRRGWVEKQISLYCDDYKAPISIHGITYRFTVKGKIKTNR